MRHFTVFCRVASCRPFFVRAMAIVVMFVASSSPLHTQTAWTQYGSGPVLDLGSPGSWDDGTVFQPCVIKDGDTLKMWYTGADNMINAGTLAIGYAWSLDGISWTRYPGNPVFAKSTGGWDNGHTGGATVLKDGDTLRMWYYGIPLGRTTVPSPYLSVGLATSVDGINWNRLSSPVLEPGVQGEWDHDIFFPGNVLKEDSLYKMWYSGGTGVFPGTDIISIGYATSRDGIHWTKYNDTKTTGAPYQFSDTVLNHGTSGQSDGQRAWSAWVMKTDTGYQMWYGGGSSSGQVVMYATSREGIHWTKILTPVLRASAWTGNILGQCVMRDSSSYRMWFSGFVSEMAAKIGYASGPATAVQQNSSFPLAFVLEQNYPNPFNPSTTIQYALPRRSHVTLIVYDALGQQVGTLVDGEVEAGYHTVQFDGSGLASGVYFYRMQAGNFVQTRKLCLIK